MPRPDRIHIEGGVYHVFNRLGRGERVFVDDEIAGAFVDLLRDVVKRDGLQGSGHPFGDLSPRRRGTLPKSRLTAMTHQRST